MKWSGGHLRKDVTGKGQLGRKQSWPFWGHAADQGRFFSRVRIVR